MSFLTAPQDLDAIRRTTRCPAATRRFRCPIATSCSTPRSCRPSRTTPSAPSSAWAASGARSASSGRRRACTPPPSGYAGGLTPNPTYEEVCSGRTGHNEVVLVVYRPAEISYDELLRIFWEGHDPTQGMRQGNDVGTQYRSGIYTYLGGPGRGGPGLARPLRGARWRTPATARSRLRSSRPASSTTPRTTTSSTWRRSRTATAASAARASPARWAWPAPSAPQPATGP